MDVASVLVARYGLRMRQLSSGAKMPAGVPAERRVRSPLRKVKRHQFAVKGQSAATVDARIAVAATELPDIHGDPCDRMIIASARLLALPVVTADPVYRSTASKPWRRPDGEG
jgi:hypothetical protein